MAAPTRPQIEQAKRLLARAGARFNGAAAAAARTHPTEGEFDNNFDGVVTGIFHIVDAFELLKDGLRREMREAEQATRIQSVVLALAQANIKRVPPATRLVDLNRRRNTSVHGEWLEVLDTDALEDAIAAGGALLAAVRSWAIRRGFDV